MAPGRYRWRLSHDQELGKLAEHTEGMRVLANEKSSVQQRQLVQFVTAGQAGKKCPKSDKTSVLAPGKDWSMRADLHKQLRFPFDITITTLRPDMVLWSTTEKRVLLVELTVPWEQNIQEAYERKKARYADLVAECQEKGWKATTYPVEIGCRGYAGLSTNRFLRDIGFTAAKVKKVLKDLSEEAEEGSFWLWLRRKDRSWGKEDAT